MFLLKFTDDLMKLTLILFLLDFSSARYVSEDVFSGFSTRTTSDDLDVSAAEPRPVIVELPQQAIVLPLIADKNAFSDTAISEASEKVEKILQKPIAFSYNHDQDAQASGIPREYENDAVVVEIDQKPEALDYYKHLENVETAESDEEDETKVKSDTNEEKSEDNEDKLDNNESSEEKLHEKSENNEDALEGTNEKSESNEEKVEDNEEKSESHDNLESHEILESHDNLENHDKLKSHDNLENHDKLESHDNLENHDKLESHVNLESNEDKPEIEEKLENNEKYVDYTSAEIDHADVKNIEDVIVKDHDAKSSGHGGGNNKGGHDYKKGGGQEHHKGHKGEKGEKGDKAYKGFHHNEKGEKGHHTKENHEKEYDEHGGQKKKHHHDDGYEAEHKQAEKGHKTSKFHEDGKHSKGHSTKGEHIIHKKDEYEKKQEFFDESHEEDGFETDGEFFHESDFKKGGSEMGGFHNGGEEEGHHGKKDHHEKGGFFKEGKGHKESKGHNDHFKHEQKYGEKESNSGGKKWSYDKGTGGSKKRKHGAKYQQADASTIPHHVVSPKYQEIELPELTLEDNFKFPSVIYPPLTTHVAQRRSDGDEVITELNEEPNHHNTSVEGSLILQSSNEELKKIENEDDIQSLATEQKQNFIALTSVINRNKGEKIGNKSNQNLSKIPYQKDVGSYSIYTLGDYKTLNDNKEKPPSITSSTISKPRMFQKATIPSIIEPGGNEKPKQFAIKGSTDAILAESGTNVSTMRPIIVEELSSREIDI